jgi:hypothetical protein
MRSWQSLNGQQIPSSYGTKRFFFSYGSTALYGPGPPRFVEASRSHTSDTPQSVGLLWTRDQPDSETSTWQHSQETDIHALGGIRTCNPSKRAAADPRLRPRGHCDRPKRSLPCSKHLATKHCPKPDRSNLHLQFLVSLFWHSAVMRVDTDISRSHPASIFTGERMWFKLTVMLTIQCERGP